MKKRKLGSQGLEVSALGLGCMGLTFAYGKTNENESLAVLQRALELGVNFWDTAEMYGPYNNEELIGRALKNISRQNIIIATKFGFKLDSNGAVTGFISTPLHVKKTIDESLKRLGTDYVDLYYQHRLDPNTPIEDTVGALADLVKAGKVRYIGLSEVSPATIRRAHAIHPITAIQSEYSLWDRAVETKILPTLRELQIGFVAFSPLGRGFFSGKLKGLNELEKNDFRQCLPRFQDNNFTHNLKLVEKLKAFAALHHATSAQMTLAWLLNQGEDIVPIPGTKHVHYLEENARAVNINLSSSAWNELQQILSIFPFEGARYPDEILKWTDNSE